MNDIRRTILWVIFGFSLVLLWDKWQVHNGKKATFFPAPAVATAGAGKKVAFLPLCTCHLSHSKTSEKPNITHRMVRRISFMKTS